MYKKVEEECARLRTQFSAQEDDRQYLIKQILYLKRDNKALREANGLMAEELDELEEGAWPRVIVMRDCCCGGAFT